jgi:hypothetical protein
MQGLLIKVVDVAGTVITTISNSDMVSKLDTVASSILSFWSYGI